MSDSAESAGGGGGGAPCVGRAVPLGRRRVVAPKPSAPSHAWCFTLNNPLVHGIDVNSPEAWFDKGLISYCCWAYEAGESATPHIQGYLRLKTGCKQRRTWLLSHLANGFWAPAKGDLQQNWNYIHKIDDPAAQQRFLQEPREIGARPVQGKRNDIVSALALVKDGASDRALFEEVPNVAVRHLSALRQYRLLCQPPRNFKTFVHVMFGPTGTGKSAAAAIIYVGAYDVAFGPTGLWWDGYDGASDIWIDDFKSGISLHMMLRLMDRYAMKVAVRGNNIQFAPARMVITSSKHPRDWFDWQKLDEDPNQLLRRIDRLEEISCPPLIRNQKLKHLQESTKEELYFKYSGDPDGDTPFAPVPKALRIAQLGNPAMDLQEIVEDIDSDEEEQCRLDEAFIEESEEDMVLAVETPPGKDSWTRQYAWPASDVSDDDQESVGSGEDIN